MEKLKAFLKKQFPKYKDMTTKELQTEKKLYRIISFILSFIAFFTILSLLAATYTVTGEPAKLTALGIVLVAAMYFGVGAQLSVTLTHISIELRLREILEQLQTPKQPT